MVVFAEAALAAALECNLAERASRWEERRTVIRCETPRAVVDFDRDSPGLAVSEREAFARLADRGVADLEALLRPAVGSVAPGRPVRFVVSARVGLSRTYGRTVLLPLARVRERRAPYLHETVHALLPGGHGSTWLSEGLACYLESWVAENLGGYDAHVFSWGGDRGIHRDAGRTLGSDLGRAVLPWVGAPGEPPDLQEERRLVARPFYVLAHSFTKHLVDHLGLLALVRVAMETDPESGLERLSGRSVAQWRAEWLARRGVAPGP